MSKALLERKAGMSLSADTMLLTPEVSCMAKSLRWREKTL